MDEILLINKFNEGEPKAWSEMVNRYQPRLYYFLKKFIQDEWQVKVIRDDGFIKIWEKKMQFGSIEELQAFLIIKAKNDAINYLERNKSLNNNLFAYSMFHGGQADTENVVALEMEHANLWAEILLEIQQQPKERREVFEMYYFDKMKASEISEIKKIHLSNVYDYKRAVENALKKKFGSALNKVIYVLFIMACLLEQII
jgi:RNA polymerase sigma factor (sigma-70 family)